MTLSLVRVHPFAPFENLGLIIIDEEHENAYKSELSPRYDAREAAAKRAQMNEASLVLGQPPHPGILHKEYKGSMGFFYPQRESKEDACLPLVEIVDLREELKENRSIFSRRLKALIENGWRKKSRSCCLSTAGGYANFVSAVPAARPSDALTAT